MINPQGHTKMSFKPSMLTAALVAVLLSAACSDPGTPGAADSGGRGGAAGATSATGGAPSASGGTAPAAAGAGSPNGSGGMVATAGSAGSNSAGGAGANGGSGAGGDTSMAGSGGSQAGGSAQGGASNTPPHVTPQNATSVPAMYGNAVANPGTFALKVMYPVYWYSQNAPASEAFQSTPTIQKQSSPIMKPCNVYTPPGYDKQTQYPLIIIMHGITDNENTWNERSNPNVAKLFDNLITSKVTEPFIAVFAYGTVNNSTNGYYAFGAELMNDLLPFIEANYSVKKDRGSRAMAGFSFGGMQTINIGLCAHLKEFAWFAGLDPAGGNANADDIAKYVAKQNPQMYPLYYFYDSVGKSDSTAGSSAAASANGLTTKGPYITSANFSFQNNIGGQGIPSGYHDYPTAEVGLYNFLRMAFAPSN
jgi:hypothetical protein